MKCTNKSYSAEYARQIVEHRDGWVAYQCAACGGIHVGPPEAVGRGTTLFSTREGRTLFHISSKIITPKK